MSCFWIIIFACLWTLSDAGKEFHHFYSGSHEDQNKRGFISSHHFASPYKIADTRYIYTIKNIEKDGYVQLVFTDLHLHPHSEITIFDDETWLESRIIHRIQGGTTYRDRVALGSRGQFLGVVFDTGCCEETNTLYQGFRAEYVLVPYPPDGWLERPITSGTLCGTLSPKGGAIVIQNLVQDSKYYDCVWVYEADPNTRAYAKVAMLTHNRKHVYTEITIHDGLTSKGTLLQTILDKRGLDKQQVRGFDSENGLYIRMKAKFHYGSKVVIAYGSYLPGTYGCASGGDEYTFYCRGTSRCIRNQLVCDEWDHCGDRADERIVDGKCAASDPSSIWPTDLSKLVCRDGLKSCDEICIRMEEDCSTGSSTDTGYYLKISLVVIVCAVSAALIIIIIVIVVCVRRSKCYKHRPGGRHRQSESDQTDDQLAAQFLQQPRPQNDVVVALHPPSYNDVIAENIQLATQLIKPEDKCDSPPPPYIEETTLRRDRQTTSDHDVDHLHDSTEALLDDHQRRRDSHRNSSIVTDSSKNSLNDAPVRHSVVVELNIRHSTSQDTNDSSKESNDIKSSKTYSNSPTSDSESKESDKRNSLESLDRASKESSRHSFQEYPDRQSLLVVEDSAPEHVDV